MNVIGKNPIIMLNEIKPIDIIIIPNVVKIRVPHLSESLPLIGAIKAIVIDVGNKYNAVIAGGMPKID
jgi:hypothetical protein